MAGSLGDTASKRRVPWLALHTIPVRPEVRSGLLYIARSASLSRFVCVHLVVCVNVCMCVCICVRVCVCVYIYIYIYIVYIWQARLHPASQCCTVLRDHWICRRCASITGGGCGWRMGRGTPLNKAEFPQKSYVYLFICTYMFRTRAYILSNPDGGISLFLPTASLPITFNPPPSLSTLT